MLDPEAVDNSSDSQLSAPQPQERRSNLKRALIDIVETIVIALLLFLVINTISARIRVDGRSMEPTLKSGQFVLVNKLAYKIGSPQYGDIIVFHYPRNPDQEYIKRVIGLPGDLVEIKAGQVFVNDQLIDEPYILNEPTYQDRVRVPVNALFVLGDNRNNSSDSHTWGAVPLESVVGKAILIYWPPQDWGILHHQLRPDGLS
jgi:signal peptidase I